MAGVSDSRDSRTWSSCVKFCQQTSARTWNFPWLEVRYTVCLPIDAGSAMLSSCTSIITAKVFIELGNISHSDQFLYIFQLQDVSAWFTWEGLIMRAKCQLPRKSGHTKEAQVAHCPPPHSSVWPGSPSPPRQARAAADVNQQNSRWLTEMLEPSPAWFSASDVTDILPFSFLFAFHIFFLTPRKQTEVTLQSTYLEAASRGSLEEKA